MDANCNQNRRQFAPPNRQASLHGLFVTGTDTGVGKTQIAAALASLLADSGVRLQPRKPAESGCIAVSGRLEPADACALKEAARVDLPIHMICPYPLEPALSPERAAMLMGIPLELRDLEIACRAGCSPDDFLLVEGAGGFYSPLAHDGLNADLAEALHLPLVLVSADRLGTIGQTLLAVEATERRGLAVEAVILNRIEPVSGSGMDNAADLARRIDYPVIVTEPFSQASSQPGWFQLRPALEGLAEELASRWRARVCG